MMTMKRLHKIYWMFRPDNPNRVEVSEDVQKVIDELWTAVEGGCSCNWTPEKVLAIQQENENLKKENYALIKVIPIFEKYLKR